MDGFPFLPDEMPNLSRDSSVQHTLRSLIECAGTGLHSGLPITVRLLPAPADHGIAFLRTDLPGSVADRLIPARFDTVVDTRLCTVIGQAETRIGTIEHLMAALFATGIDNALIETSGPEIPVFDGSSEPWLFLLDCAGRAPQEAPRRQIEVLNTIRVEDNDSFAELRPGRHGLEMALSIAFDAPAIGRQALSFTLDSPGARAAAFRRELARARTFTQKHEVEGLQRAGLAQGGTLDNAVVVAGAEILNPTGLRAPDEFVRHKMLDAVGDLALAGAALQARFIGHKSGHALNNRLLRALFANPANWRDRTQTPALLAA